MIVFTSFVKMNLKRMLNRSSSKIIRYGDNFFPIGGNFAIKKFYLMLWFLSISGFDFDFEIKSMGQYT